MNCENAIGLIHARVDGELGEAQATRLKAHLSSCGACQQQARQFDAMQDAWALLSIETGAVPVTTTHRPHWLSWSCAAAAIIALFIGLQYSVIPNGRTPAPVVASSSGAGVEVRLTGATIQRYIPVSQPTTTPHVHVVWLLENLNKNDSDDPSSESHSPSKPHYVRS
jgi:anti-sigma factor RsiW